jgi:hypothetical protein
MSLALEVGRATASGLDMPALLRRLCSVASVTPAS